MALADGLVSYWNFEEAGGDLLDQVGNNDGTNDGASYQATGRVNYGWDFELTETDGVTIPHDASLNVSDISFGCWFKAESQNIMIFMDKRAIPSYPIHLYTFADGRVGYIITNTDHTQYTHVEAGAYSAGNWCFVMITYKRNGTTKMYINGSEVNSQPVADLDVDTSLVDFRMGKRLDGLYPFDGIMDEAGIWDRELSSDEVTELWNGGAGLTYPFPTVGTNMQINIGDAWKEISAMKINIDDAWKEVTSAQINIGDAWKEVF